MPNRHDLEIEANAVYAAYEAAIRAHNATVVRLPLRLRMVYEAMQAEQFGGNYERADVDALLEWVPAVTATHEAAAQATAALEDVGRRQREFADEESRHATVTEAQVAVREAEVRELGAGVRALARIGRLEGDVADLAALTMPLLKGTRVTKRDDRGRIVETVRA